MNHALAGAATEFMTTTELNSLRQRYPELIRRGRVLEMAREFGVTVWTMRMMIDGDDPTIVPVPIKGRRWYRREAVLAALGGPPIDNRASVGASTHA